MICFRMLWLAEDGWGGCRIFKELPAVTSWDTPSNLPGGMIYKWGVQFLNIDGTKQSIDIYWYWSNEHVQDTKVQQAQYRESNS